MVLFSLIIFLSLYCFFLIRREKKNVVTIVVTNSPTNITTHYYNTINFLPYGFYPEVNLLKIDLQEKTITFEGTISFQNQYLCTIQRVVYLSLKQELFI